MSSTCQGVASNSEIAGIGIRINLYVALVLRTIIPAESKYHEILSRLDINNAVACLGLLVTAITQTVTDQLPLFDALFVFHILFFLGASAFHPRRHKHTMARLIIGIISKSIVVIAFLGWGLYLWFHVKDFGPQNECNDKVKYVIMFVSIRATSGGLRKFYIFFHIYLSVGTLGALVLQQVYISRLAQPDVEESKGEVTRNDEGEEDRPKASRWLQLRDIAALLMLLPFLLVLGMSMMPVESKREDRPWYWKWPIFPLLSTINVISMLELTVWRNDEKHGGVVLIDNSWGFGQVLAVVMIIAILYEIGHVLLGRITLNRAHSGGPQAGSEEASQQAEKD